MNINVGLVSKMFPHTPRSNIEDNLDYIITALRKHKLLDKPMLLMALATIRAETEGFQPISEIPSRYNTDPGGHLFNRYDFRLGNKGPPDGRRYRGRGFIQLTGRSNYAVYGQRISIDLVRNPDLANQPEVAAELLAVFLKDKEAAIRKALNARDLKLARKLVNGGQHGLTRFTEAYNIGEKVIQQSFDSHETLTSR